MIQTIASFTEQFGVIIPVVIGLVAVGKKIGLASRYAPILAIALGVLAGYFYISPDTNGVLFGIIAGLSSSGLYSSTKTVVNN